MDKNSGCAAPPIPGLPATSLRQAIEPEPAGEVIDQFGDWRATTLENRPERNDVRKPHRACCPQSMADRNQPINWGNLIFSRDRDQCLLRFFVNLSKPTNLVCAFYNTGKLEMYANFLRYSGLQSYKWSLPICT